jgi:hypothetical protein
MFVCMCVCVCVCVWLIFTYINTHIHIYVQNRCVSCRHACMYVCMHVCICMYVCMYVCIYRRMISYLHSCFLCVIETFQHRFDIHYVVSFYLSCSWPYMCHNLLFLSFLSYMCHILVFLSFLSSHCYSNLISVCIYMDVNVSICEGPSNSRTCCSSVKPVKQG